MILAMPLVSHVLMSLIMLSIPHLTRRELLFGVIVPVDFRERPEGRQAIRAFRIAVAIPAVAGLAAMLLNPRLVALMLLAPMTMMVCGFIAFVIQNRKLKAFAVQPQPVRELELSAEPERLPRFAWLALVPFLLLASVAFYMHSHWDSIPERHPIHWMLDGRPDKWTERSFRGVYGPMILAAGMNLWLFGFALAMWYGSRRSEPLRRPGLAVFILLGWVPALMMCSLTLQPLIKLPLTPMALASMAIILSSIVYLVKKNREFRGPLDPTPKECWKGGILYYNPNDPVLFVGRRDGAGFTLNMGNPWSWAVLASPLLLMVTGYLAMP
jgi:uncharacterized membrane protein